MKKRIVSLMLVLTCCLCTKVNAVEPRLNNNLRYQGALTVPSNGTAVCELSVQGNSDVSISATIDLQVKTSSGGYTGIIGWYLPATGSLSFQKTVIDSRIIQGDCRLQCQITASSSSGTDSFTLYYYG